MPGLKKDDIKKLLKYLKPIYTNDGSELTDARLENLIDTKILIDQSLSTAVKSVADKKELNKKLLKSYPNRASEAKPTKEGEGRYPNFGRIYATMIRPGYDKVSVNFNKRLSELSATYKGQREILKMAGDMVINADQELMFGQRDDVMENYDKHFSEFEILGISKDIKEAIDKADQDEKYEGDFVEKFKNSREDADYGIYLSAIAEYEGHPLKKFMPSDFDVYDINDKINSGKFFDPKDNISQEDEKYLRDFITSALNAQVRIDGFDDMVKKHYQERVQKANLTIAKLKGNRKDLVFLDEKGKLVPDNTVVKFDDKYAVFDNLGNIQGFRVNKDAKMERLDAKFPERFRRNYQNQVNSSLAAIDELSCLNEKFDGIYGETVLLDPDFADVAKKLDNSSDYTINQNISKEAKDVLTYVTFLSPDIVKDLETSSTIAGETLEGKTEFAAVDWLVGNDERSVGFDVALSNVRNNMSNVIEKAEKGDKEKLKKDFESATKVFARYFMNDQEIGVSTSSRFTLVVADKFAKVIQENPYGVADNIPEGMKNVIMMKSALHQLDMKAAKAKAQLLTAQNLDPEKKKELIKQVIVTREIRKIMKDTAPQYDVFQHLDDVFKKVTNRPEKSEGYKLVAAKITEFPKEFRSMEPTEIERAMAQKLPDLVKAVEDSISNEDMERMVNSPRFCIEDAINKTTIPSDKIKVPHTDEIKLSDEFKANRKKEFDDEMLKMIIDAENEAQRMRERGEAPSNSTPMKQMEKYADKISMHLNHTKAGITGPSAEFKEVELAYKEMMRYIDKPECSAKAYVCARKLSEIGKAYLEDKLNQGVDPEADDRAGNRYRDILNVVENANYVANFAKTQNERAHKSEDIKYDHLRIEDAMHADALLINLKEAREKLDDADPFFYHSTDDFKKVQRALDRSIECLERFGNKKLSASEKAGLVDALSTLNESAQTYMIEKANPGSSLGKARMSAIEAVYNASKGQAHEIDSRNSARDDKRAIMAQQLDMKNAEKAKIEEIGKENSRIQVEAQKALDKHLERYNLIEVKSNKEIDPNDVVTKLANKVQSTVTYMKDVTKKPVPPFPTITKQIKSILVKRMVLDMISEERKQSKEGIVEKAYIKNPKTFENTLLKLNEVEKAMNNYLAGNNTERLEAFNTLDRITTEKIDHILTAANEQEEKQQVIAEEKKQQAPAEDKHEELANPSVN